MQFMNEFLQWFLAPLLVQCMDYCHMNNENTLRHSLRRLGTNTFSLVIFLTVATPLPLKSSQLLKITTRHLISIGSFRTRD